MVHLGPGLGLIRMLCGGLFFLLFWGAVIALIVWGLRALSRSGSGRAGMSGTSGGNYAPPAGPGSPSRALDILQERYARGEITKEQYDQMRRDLQE